MPIYNSNRFPDCGVLYYQEFDSNDQLRLLSKLSEKIRGSSFDLGDFLATGRQAMEQTVNTVHALRQSLVALHKGNLRSALRYLGFSPGQRSYKRMKNKLELGDVSGTWLAMQYGWLPTLSDIYDAWKIIEGRDPGPRTKTYVATIKTNKRYDGSASPSNYSCSNSAQNSRRIEYRVTESLSVPRALGLYDPLGVMWEVTMWSFVFDWFIPIGSYLDALSVFPFVSGEWQQTDMVRMRGALSDIYSPSSFSCTYISGYKPDGTPIYANSGPWPSSKSGGSSSVSTGSVTRTVGSSPLAVPRPKFKPFSSAMSPAHIRNALALAHQQLIRFM